MIDEDLAAGMIVSVIYGSSSTMGFQMIKATLVDFHNQRSTLCSHSNNRYSLRDFETFGDVRVYNFLCNAPPFFLDQSPPFLGRSPPFLGQSPPFLGQSPHLMNEY